jgi:hypothetical protein
VATINAVGNGLSGATGTGNFVGANSPTITTPIIATIRDTAGLSMLTTSATASAVNNVQLTNSATLTPVIVSAVGTDTNININLQGKGTGGVGLKGITDGTNAASGYVGEIVDSGSQSGTYTVSTTVYNVASISLTAGDWDVYGSCLMTPSTFNVNNVSGGINSTSATIPANGLTSQFYVAIDGPTITGLGAISNKCFTRISISSTTTVYLCSQSTWTGGSAPTFVGQIYARRAR